jgi:hypothetical protein
VPEHDPLEPRPPLPPCGSHRPTSLALNPPTQQVGDHSRAIVRVLDNRRQSAPDDAQLAGTGGENGRYQAPKPP